MSKAKYSERDSRGKPYIACCECDRGGNGSDENKCSSGWRSKKWDYKACFMGTLISGLTLD